MSSNSSSASSSALPPTYVAGFHDEASVRRMKYRKLGSRVVSHLTYGASALGGAFGKPGAIEESRAILHHAIKSGINLIDVAPWYGHGSAESILGEALIGVPREAYYLTTKCARYHPGPLEMFDFSRERVVSSVKESLARLQLTYIDTLQVHDPEFAPSLDIVVSETLAGMMDCVRLGLVKAIGITGYPLSMLRELHGKAAALGIPIESCLSYSHYNLHDTSLVDSGTLSYMAGAGVGVLNGSPLSMSLLTASGAPAWHPANKELKERALAAAAFAKAAGFEFERLGMMFALAQPDIPTTLFSTSKLDKLKANLAMALGDAPLSTSESQAITDIRAKFFSGPGYESIQSWEGAEVQKVQAKIGRALLTEWYKAIAEARGKGEVAPSSIVAAAAAMEAARAPK